MQNITTVAELRSAIEKLEVEQLAKAQLLKIQFHLTYESLKPINILKNTLNDVATSPWLINNIIGTAAGLASGYISKKIVIAGSSNIFRKILGSVLQFGVTNVVARHPDAIKTFGEYIYQHVFSKKEHISS